MTRKNKKSVVKTRHHILPKSRGGTSSPGNISRLESGKHKTYHLLFSNMTPEEIISDLANNYWNGNWDYVRYAYNKNEVEKRQGRNGKEEDLTELL